MEAAGASFDRAIDVARRQGSRFLELRATVSKARLMAKRGLRKPAQDLLAPVYGSFTEGLDTADLIEARMLLEDRHSGEAQGGAVVAAQ